MVAPHSSLVAAKATLRRQALAARQLVAGAGHALAAAVIGQMPPPRGAVVAGFWPIGNEIDIRPLLHHLAARGLTVVLPVTPKRGQPLGFRRWQPGDTLVPGPMGTLQPAADGAPVAPDWLLVPLLAFDRTGARLGYGGGYYDRTLAGLPGAVALGVAYAAQEVEAVPAGPHDVRLEAVATERGIVRCGAPA